MSKGVWLVPWGVWVVSGGVWMVCKGVCGCINIKSNDKTLYQVIIIIYCLFFQCSIMQKKRLCLGVSGWCLGVSGNCLVAYLLCLMVPGDISIIDPFAKDYIRSDISFSSNAL